MKIDNEIAERIVELRHCLAGNDFITIDQRFATIYDKTWDRFEELSDTLELVTKLDPHFSDEQQKTLLKSIKAIRGRVRKHFQGVMQVMNENDNLAAVEKLDREKVKREGASQ